MSFGKILKRLREERDLKQKYVASKIGIGYNALSYYELDKREPDLETLKKLANFYNVSIDYLLENLNKEDLIMQKNKELADSVEKLLVDMNIVEKDEELSDEKRERLLNLFKKALEMSRI